MSYCAIDFGKREYDFNVSSLSNRNSSKLLGCFVYLARKFPHLVWDRFGIIDDNLSISPLPRNTDISLIEASFKRAKSLGPCYIAWSGGIDSSFIISVFKDCGIDFKVLYNSQSLDNEAAFVILETLKKEKVECIKLDNLSQYSLYSKVITGDGADILFAPGKGDLFIDSPILYKGVRLTLFETLEYVYPQEAIYLYGMVKLYGDKLDRPISNDLQISRLLQWGCLYHFKRDYFRVITGSDVRNMIPFFDTRIFSDISYSKFWNMTYEDGHKQLQRKYISKVFGNKRLYSLLKRNPSPYLRSLTIPDYHWL